MLIVTSDCALMGMTVVGYTMKVACGKQKSLAAIPT